MFHKTGCTLIIYINCYFRLCRIYYFIILHKKVVAGRCSVRNFTKFTGNNQCHSLLFNKTLQLQACNFINKETLAQVFSCGFCEISKKHFFHRTPPVAASVHSINCTLWSSSDFLKKILFSKAISYSFVWNMFFFSESLWCFL